jgi:hypothetical protein
MKTAVLLCGQMRTWKDPDVLQSLLSFFAGFELCDIFVSTWDEQGVSYNHGAVVNGENSQQKVTDSLIRETYPGVKGVSIHSLAAWESALSPTYNQIYKEGFMWNGGHIKGTVVPQLFTLWDANRLRKAYERQSGTRYDVVLRCRPDARMHFSGNRWIDDFSGISAINNPASGTFFPNRIYDIFFYGPSRAMDALSDAYNHLEFLEAHTFQNGLDKRDACRILRVQALVHDIPVRDIPFDVCHVMR